MNCMCQAKQVQCIYIYCILEIVTNLNDIYMYFHTIIHALTSNYLLLCIPQFLLFPLR